MKRRILTERDITQDLHTELNKRKQSAIFLTVISCLMFCGCITYAVHYFMGEPLQGRMSFIDPTAKMVILFSFDFILVLHTFQFYYWNMYLIKAGKYAIGREELCRKEQKRYYDRGMSGVQYRLHFNSGYVVVEKDIYLNTKVGDTFHLVILYGKHPFLAYNADNYVIASYVNE